jgi:hypothetical protein
MVPELGHCGGELDELLNTMDRAEANLAKLEAVWDRALPFIPSGPARGSHPAYDDLRSAWDDLLPGLSPADGWTITERPASPAISPARILPSTGTGLAGHVGGLLAGVLSN